MLVITPYYLHEINKEVDTKLIALILSGALFAVIPSSYYFNNYISNKEKDRKMIIYLIASSIIFSVLIINIFDEAALKYTIIFVFLIISCNILENLTTNLFSKIIPADYELWTFNASFVIQIFTNTGRILGSLMLFFDGFKDYLTLNRITFSITASLFIITLVITLIHYKDLRVKAIARILRSKTRKRKQSEI